MVMESGVREGGSEEEEEEEEGQDLQPAASQTDRQSGQPVKKIAS